MLQQLEIWEEKQRAEEEEMLAEEEEVGWWELCAFEGFRMLTSAIYPWRSSPLVASLQQHLYVEWLLQNGSETGDEDWDDE